MFDIFLRKVMEACVNSFSKVLRPYPKWASASGTAEVDEQGGIRRIVVTFSLPH